MHDSRVLMVPVSPPGIYFDGTGKEQKVLECFGLRDAHPYLRWPGFFPLSSRRFQQVKERQARANGYRDGIRYG